MEQGTGTPAPSGDASGGDAVTALAPNPSSSGVAGVYDPSLPTVDRVGHGALAGTYRTRIEANGRLVLPSAVRNPFTEAGSARVRFQAHQRNLAIYTPRSFDVTVTTVLNRQPGGVVDPRLRLAVYNSAQPVTVDTQARFVVPPELRERIGLPLDRIADVVLTGSVECLELWPAAGHDELEDLADAFDLLLNNHDGLDLPS